MSDGRLDQEMAELLARSRTGDERPASLALTLFVAVVVLAAVGAAIVK